MGLSLARRQCWRGQGGQEAAPSACRKASPALPTFLARRFVVGYINQQFRLTFLWLSAGGGISAVVRSTPTLSANAPCLRLRLRLSLRLRLRLHLHLRLNLRLRLQPQPQPQVASPLW